MKRNISKKDFYRLLLWFAGDQSRLLGWIRSNASCGSVTVVRLPWLKRGCRQDLNSTFISLVRSDSEHSHRSCSIPGWIPIPHIKRCFYRFWYDPSGSNPLSVFYKKLLVGRDGIYSLFESYSENPKPFWWSPFGFLLWRKVSFESFTFDLRFFPIHRSWKYRIIRFIWFIWNPVFQLVLWHSRNHLAVKKWFRDSAAGPILPDLAGFFNYHDGPALLSFLVAALPVILNRLPRVSWPWFCVPWCVYNIPYKNPGVYWQSRYTYDALFV